jgi:hypothetical protein
VAAIGKEYNYVKRDVERTLAGKVVEIAQPARRIMVPMDSITEHYMTTSIHTNCNNVDGRLQHCHDDKLFLILKFVEAPLPL